MLTDVLFEVDGAFAQAVCGRFFEINCGPLGHMIDISELLRNLERIERMREPLCLFCCSLAYVRDVVRTHLQENGKSSRDFFTRETSRL